MSICSNVYGVCLEEIHINMVITKLIAILSEGKVKKLIFASVDKSPHCVQLHHMKNEILRSFSNCNFEIINYVIVDNELLKIDYDVIKTSKNLKKLQEIKNNGKWC